MQMLFGLQGQKRTCRLKKFLRQYKLLQDLISWLKLQFPEPANLPLPRKFLVRPHLLVLQHYLLFRQKLTQAYLLRA